MLDLIRREGDARSGKPARIIAKLNRVADSEIVTALYDASQSGFRSTYCPRHPWHAGPGVPSLSENIGFAASLAGCSNTPRLLFRKRGNYEIYMAAQTGCQKSRPPCRGAHAIETFHSRVLKDTYLQTYLRDNTGAHSLQVDGSYVKVEPAEGEEKVNSQLKFQGDLGFFPDDTETN